MFFPTWEEANCQVRYVWGNVNDYYGKLISQLGGIVEIVGITYDDIPSLYHKFYKNIRK